MNNWGNVRLILLYKEKANQVEKPATLCYDIPVICHTNYRAAECGE